MSDAQKALDDLEKDIATLEKKLAEKKALLPGIRYMATKQGGGATANAETDGKMRLRLGASALKILEYLEIKNEVLPTELLEGAGLSRDELKNGYRALNDRKLVIREDEKVVITSLGRTFLEKYREKH